VVDSLGIAQAKTASRLATLRLGSRRLRTGRGSQLGALIEHTLDRLGSVIETLDSQVNSAATIGDAASRDALLLIISKQYQRLQPQMDVIHLVLATYGESVGRADVPVGLQHLIDLLMEQVVSEPGDPIVHLNSQNMYSTRDVVLLLDELLNGVGGFAPSTDYAGVHPITFNLPAMDPDNALLSPVLAHEVAHTAVEQLLMGQLMAQIDHAALDGLFDACLAGLGVSSTSPAANALAKQFQGWCSELLSDAVALVLTGPSFVYAFTTFALPSDFPIVGTHPPVRDRIRFHMTLLRALGWGDLMVREAPQITSWLDAVSANQVLAGTAEETFLRDAMRLIEPAISVVARSHISDPIGPSDLEPALEEAVSWLQQGVPAVEYSGTVLSPWQIVLLGWVAAFRESGDTPESLPKGAGDHRFNAVLVKALEMSSIVTSWRLYERADS
jgi:hypothetical protein